MKELLKELGFVELGPLHRHPELNIVMDFTKVTSKVEFMKKLIEYGAQEQNALIRATIGIK